MAHKEIVIPTPNGCTVMAHATELRIRFAAGDERKVLAWAHEAIKRAAEAVVEAETDRQIEEEQKKRIEEKARRERMAKINSLIEEAKGELPPSALDQLLATINPEGAKKADVNSDDGNGQK